MATFRRFEDIDAWQRARVLTREVYAASRQGSFGRDFGLRDQIQRASVSVMSNIAEGFDRSGNREFMHFLSVAKGSVAEVRSQLYVALDAGHLDRDAFQQLSTTAKETSRLIGGLMKYLRQSNHQGVKFSDSDA